MLSALVLVLALGGLTVQSDWKIAGVAVATSRTAALTSSTVRRTLDRAADLVEENLEGIRWHVDRDVRFARYRDEDGPPVIDGRGMRALVERLAERDESLAACDVVFVYAPLPDSDYSGMSVLRAFPKGRAPLWYSVVNTTQGAHFARVISKRVGVDEETVRPLAAAFDRGPLRALALHATTVHEFGHFLAPGTRDVRAVKDLAGWIGNGESEPEKHDLSCIMFTPREPKSLLAKVREFPRVIHFCDKCRERLGCP